MLPFCVPPYVSHPPSERTETLRPVGPKWRKIMSFGSNLLSTAAMLTVFGWVVDWVGKRYEIVVKLFARCFEAKREKTVREETK